MKSAATDGRFLILAFVDERTGYFSKSAMDSTCEVCGNMSITPADVSRNPCWLTRMPASRASEAGWQDT